MTGETKNNQEKKKKNQVPFRLNILFIVVFLLFSVLILRLGIVQIVNGQKYQQKVQGGRTQTSQLDSTRGLIYGSGGELLVGNKAEKAITFTRTKQDTPQNLLHLAQKLSHYITMKTNQVTVRDEKDYWILKHGLQNAYNLKLSKAEYNKLQNNSTKAYNLLLSRITKKDLSKFNSHDMQVMAIYRKLSQAMNLTPFYVKVGVADKAYYRIGEHLSSLPGINLTVTSSRYYPNGNYFYLGSVGQIPQGKLDYYLVRGYNRNDKVGTSNLEQYYEGVLNGTPTKLKYKLNQNGDAVGNPKKVGGRRGDDLVLTVNAKYQKKVQQILKSMLKKALANPRNKHLHSAYAVVVNPNTGGILALAGWDYKNGSFVNTAYKTVTGSFAVGSTVKGATELAGYQTGTIPSSFNDMPIMGRVRKFSSYPGNRIGTVTPEQALEVSSNVFMGKIACNLAGIKLKNAGNHYDATYVPPPGSPKVVNAFKTLRNIYSEFGLGVKTGVDLPNEGLGYLGPIPPPQTGLILRYVIGQYDTYTPLEIAQYMSTIANGGYRMQLHFLKAVRAPSSKPGTPGRLLYQYQPNILDHITMSQHNLQRVKNGFWLVTHGSYLPTASALGRAPYAKYRIAGKTGTADVYLNNGKVHTVNELFSGYAPAKSNEKPQIAFTVIFPGLDGKRELKNPAVEYQNDTAGKIVQAYFQMKNQK